MVGMEIRVIYVKYFPAQFEIKRGDSSSIRYTIVQLIMLWLQSAMYCVHIKRYVTYNTMCVT